jgi:flagellar biosynthesis protein FlhA
MVYVSLWLQKYRDLLLPVALISCLGVILVPLPPMLMDMLLAANITISVIVLLTTLYIRSPMEFNIFPALLVTTTLARLVLNIATTRLILTEVTADDTTAAGSVILAFGNFVAGDRLEVGLILFVIIFVIQFLVITKGATRISEVAARFALDGMPGRQMAIDADLNAGVIDEKEAQRRREGVQRQADFYGAMDGASKYVRGDAVAGIVVTTINIVGGFYMGYMHAGMTLQECAEVFTKLTIGDGLVSQVPAFLISLAAALLVTRSTQEVNLSGEFISQLFSRPQALIVAGVFLILMIFTQLPTVPMLSLGLGCIGIAYFINKQNLKQTSLKAEKERQAEIAKASPPEKKVEDYLEIDPMRVELGAGLIPLADPKRGGDLMQRISTVRAMLASELGILLPKVRIKDRMSLGESQYEVQIAGAPVATGFLRTDRLLAIDTGMTTGFLPGDETREPAFQRRAWWIDSSLRQQAEIYGYQVAEPVAVLATHVQEIARRHADELLTRDQTKQLIDQLKQTSPTVVEELMPGLMKLADIQHVLQLLLREDIPIRQLSTILETLGDNAQRLKDPMLLTEYVRHRLARTISQRFRDNQQRLHVVTLDPSMEDRIAASMEHTDRGLLIRMSPPVIEATCQQIAIQIKKLEQAGRPRILLVSPRIRPAVRQITQNYLPDLRVLSYNEVTRDTQLEAIGLVSDSSLNGGQSKAA